METEPREGDLCPMCYLFGTCLKSVNVVLRRTVLTLSGSSVSLAEDWAGFEPEVSELAERCQNGSVSDSAQFVK